MFLSQHGTQVRLRSLPGWVEGPGECVGGTGLGSGGRAVSWPLSARLTAPGCTSGSLLTRGRSGPAQPVPGPAGIRSPSLWTPSCLHSCTPGAGLWGCHGDTSAAVASLVAGGTQNPSGSHSGPQTQKAKVRGPCSRGLDSKLSSALLSGSGTLAKLFNQPGPQSPHL